MNGIQYSFVFLLIFINISQIICWTDEDLQLFDLVESTDRKFYDILGVDQKASPSDIRKAYRKLSQQYHPDRNKDPDAEETFRKIASIAEVLRNEEQRKKYDIILQTGLPDWREPIYYYRRVRNMGLLELLIFLLGLATFGQYLFAWSVYWEKKYEIEEIFSSKLKKKNKHQRKGKYTKTMEDCEQTSLEIQNLPKPKYQDLFPIRLVCFCLFLVKCSPSFLKFCFESLQSLRTPSPEPEEDEEIETKICSKRETRPKMKKHAELIYPEFNAEADEQNLMTDYQEKAQKIQEQIPNGTKKFNSESDVEFKKALKKFPNGTLQRWEKIAEYLNCPVSEIVAMAKNPKTQQFTRNVPISAQGLTGFDDFQNGGFKIKDSDDYEVQNGIHSNGTVVQRNLKPEGPQNSVDVIWKQEEQKLLEMALQKYPKDCPARWERIAEFVKTKTKDECVMRYRWLAQEIKRKKEKER